MQFSMHKMVYNFSFFHETYWKIRSVTRFLHEIHCRIEGETRFFKSAAISHLKLSFLPGVPPSCHQWSRRKQASERCGGYIVGDMVFGVRRRAQRTYKHTHTKGKKDQT